MNLHGIAWHKIGTGNFYTQLLEPIVSLLGSSISM